MQRLRIGSVMNTADDTRINVAVNAVGFMIDAAVCPLNLQVQSDTGQIYYPRRGEVVYMKSVNGFTFIYPDTWAGNFDSTFGQIATFEGDYDKSKNRLGDGSIYAIFFESEAEIVNYVPPRTLSPVYFIPRIESIAVSERYMFSQLDFATCELAMNPQSSGYYANFYVYSGESPSSITDLVLVDLLGFLQANDGAVTDYVRQRLSVANLPSLGIICHSTDIVDSNNEVAVLFKFVDKVQANRVEGTSYIGGEFTITNGTVTLNIPLPPATAQYAYFMVNDGATTITNAGVDNLFWNPVDDAYENAGTIMNDATLTAGEGGTTKQTTGAQAVQWRGTVAVGTSTLAWGIWLKH